MKNSHHGAIKTAQHNRAQVKNSQLHSTTEHEWRAHNSTAPQNTREELTSQNNKATQHNRAQVKSSQLHSSHFTAQHRTTQSITPQQHSASQHSTIQTTTTPQNTAQHSTIRNVFFIFVYEPVVRLRFLDPSAARPLRACISSGHRELPSLDRIASIQGSLACTTRHPRIGLPPLCFALHPHCSVAASFAFALAFALPL